MKPFTKTFTAAIAPLALMAMFATEARAQNDASGPVLPRIPFDAAKCAGVRNGLNSWCARFWGVVLTGDEKFYLSMPLEPAEARAAIQKKLDERAAIRASGIGVSTTRHYDFPEGEVYEKDKCGTNEFVANYWTDHMPYMPDAVRIRMGVITHVLLRADLLKDKNYREAGADIFADPGIVSGPGAVGLLGIKNGCHESSRLASFYGTNLKDQLEDDEQPLIEEGLELTYLEVAKAADAERKAREAQQLAPAQ